MRFVVWCVLCRWWRRTACGRCWFCPIRWSFTPLYPLSLHISRCTPRHNQPCCTIHRFTPANSLLTTFTSCLRFLSSLSRVSRSTHFCTHLIHLVYRSCATDWLVRAWVPRNLRLVQLVWPLSPTVVNKVVLPHAHWIFLYAV